jgi:hypothetical protein
MVAGAAAAAAVETVDTLVVVDTQIAVGDVDVDNLLGLLFQLEKPTEVNIGEPRGFLQHHKHFDYVCFFFPMTPLCQSKLYKDRHDHISQHNAKECSLDCQKHQFQRL